VLLAATDDQSTQRDSAVESQRSIQPGALAPTSTSPRLADGITELRPLGVHDAAEHLAGEDDELVRWLKGSPGTLQGTLDWLHRCEECWRLGGPVFAFGIRDVGREILLGTVVLQAGGSSLEPGQAVISYGLYPRPRGRGVAVRACRLACVFAAQVMTNDPWAVREVVAHIDPFNVRSLRVAHRAGFRHVGLCLQAGAAWELFALDLGRRRPSMLPPPSHAPSPVGGGISCIGVAVDRSYRTGS
jgi:RimJ/RimL family protein N-acetyltransferase